MQFEQGAAIVRERSGGLCECCGQRGNQTHHRRARGMGGRRGAGLVVNMPSNLVRVCSGCHDWIEASPDEADALGLLHPQDSSDPVWLKTVYGLAWYRLDDEGCYQFVDLEPPAGLAAYL